MSGSAPQPQPQPRRLSRPGRLAVVAITAGLALSGLRAGQKYGSEIDAEVQQRMLARTAVSPPMVPERLGPEVAELLGKPAPEVQRELVVLAVVSEPQSSRYRFLAKRRFLAHVDPSRIGAVLDRARPEDQQISEMCAEAKRRQRHSGLAPLERKVKGPSGELVYAARPLVDSRTDGVAATAVAAVRRPAPDLGSATATAAGRAAGGAGLALGLLLGLIVGWGRGARMVRALREHAFAYGYVTPAAIGMLVLVLAPFAFGMALAFFHHDGGGQFSFAGLDNFLLVLTGSGPAGSGLWKPQGFYYTLLVTVVWTALNLALHVSIGLFLALILRNPLLRLRGFYRVLLILPWAIPNYITALIWKGMFHRQYGAINRLLEVLGLQPVDWFSHFATAFAANLAANTWLGFPFMMVVCLGALESIPRDLYEAADVDGASAWQQFKAITVPMLRPALFPAIILSSIWTFNMFNVIFLVSGGEPSASTEILITEAYRWAFKRGEQYGIASAYGAIIFFILLAYSWLMARSTRATEAVA